MSEAPATTQPALRRELGLRDLTLFTLACVVGTRWISAAAHNGPGSIVLWILAALFFMVPLAFTVGALSAKYPQEGGLYAWTRNDFGPWHGFLAFWIYWVGIAFWFPNAAMAYMSIAVYTLGPQYSHLADSRVYVLTASLAAIWIALGTNLVGVNIGKWTENLGGIATYMIAALLAVLAGGILATRGSATRFDITPGWNWSNLNFWSQIAYALTGLELAPMMGGEIKDPIRNVPRAAWMASAAAVLFYCLATAALLVMLPPRNIDILHGVAEGAQTASQTLGFAWASPVLAALILVTALGQFGGLGSATSRLPFAAGADALLPAALARVHPRWRTPYVSLLTLAGVCTFLLVVMQLGDTMRAAYQELVSLMVIGGFVPYIYVFLSGWKCGCRLSAISGLSITALALACSLIPTADVTSVWLFEAKLIGGSLLLVVCGWLMYRHARRRASA